MLLKRVNMYSCMSATLPALLLLLLLLPALPAAPMPTLLLGVPLLLPLLLGVPLLLLLLPEPLLVLLVVLLAAVVSAAIFRHFCTAVSRSRACVGT
jgi:hypothetical protein